MFAHASLTPTRSHLKHRKRQYTPRKCDVPCRLLTRCAPSRCYTSHHLAICSPEAIGTDAMWPMKCERKALKAHCSGLCIPRITTFRRRASELDGHRTSFYRPGASDRKGRNPANGFRRRVRHTDPSGTRGWPTRPSVSNRCFKQYLRRTYTGHRSRRQYSGAYRHPGSQVPSYSGEDWVALDVGLVR
jgi:hypothetical protein